MAINLRDYSRTAAQRGWGPGWPTDRRDVMATITTDRSRTKIAAHRRVARMLDLILDAVEARGYLLVPGWCWGFAGRYIAGTKTPSNHSWGLAVDINAPNNPYTTSGRHDIPDWVYDLFGRYGWANGGDYTGPKKDWMHFEFMGTPEQADEMTALAQRELGSGSAAPSPPAPSAPPFPLPSGYYFGPLSGPKHSISGQYRGDRPEWRDGLRTWQTQMAHRGWRITPDGYYGDETRRVALAFQREKGLGADGLIGPATWAAAWTAPIT